MVSAFKYLITQVSDSWNMERRQVGEKRMLGMRELLGGSLESSFALIASAQTQPPTGALSYWALRGHTILQLVQFMSVLTLLLETPGKIFLKPSILKPYFQQLQ